MSINAIGAPGFGVGGRFGTPTTVGVASSTSVTLTGSAYLTTQYMLTFNSVTLLPLDMDLISLQAFSTANGVTATYYVGNVGALFYNDNQSFKIANTSSVSVSAVLIAV